MRDLASDLESMQPNDDDVDKHYKGISLLAGTKMGKKEIGIPLPLRLIHLLLLLLLRQRKIMKLDILLQEKILEGVLLIQ